MDFSGFYKQKYLRFRKIAYQRPYHFKMQAYDENHIWKTTKKSLYRWKQGKYQSNEGPSVDLLGAVVELRNFVLLLYKKYRKQRLQFEVFIEMLLIFWRRKKFWYWDSGRMVPEMARVKSLTPLEFLTWLDHGRKSHLWFILFAPNLFIKCSEILLKFMHLLLFSFLSNRWSSGIDVPEWFLFNSMGVFLF